MKNERYYKIKDWFQSKIELPNGFHCCKYNDIDYVRESEKAILVSLECYAGEFEKLINVWVPKKCFNSKEDVVKAEKEAKARFEEGARRYEDLLYFCKTNNVKGARKGLRTSTLMNLIAKAGLAYNA